MTTDARLSSLTERAHQAAVFIARQTDMSAYGPYRGEEQARTAIRLASTLGIDPDEVTTSPDWLRRHRGPGEPVLATVRCPVSGEDFTFLNRQPVYTDEPLHLLQPCPECGKLVPVAEIRDLADLGTFLATDQTPDDDLFDEDPAHSPECQWREGA
ncbi:hypothetical protein [Streptomyces sp. N35]|uniref:hypothetical protein n=1 Tax=Streptomyces sp. N35 TaxID=2795730 RepID=UPI0018F470C9|nr:hypothetical protein [Streptomyces sp. N35]